MLRLSWKIAGVALGIGATSAMAGLLGDTLSVNGNRTPVDVRMIGGSAYVKFSDVAKALDMTLIKTGSGQYELTKAGGANEVHGLRGKIGDTLFDGKWRFTVLSVDTPESYTMKSDSEPYGSGGYDWNRTTRLLKAAAGHTLVVINCRVSNGVKERRTLWTAISDDKIRTALADDSGSSRPPIAYDYDGAPTQTQYLLPGAQLTIPVIFSVPAGTRLTDLVFTLKNNQTDQQGTDVRVTLVKP
jgi:hypothetical protein